MALKRYLGANCPAEMLFLKAAVCNAPAAAARHAQSAPSSLDDQGRLLIARRPLIFGDCPGNQPRGALIFITCNRSTRTSVSRVQSCRRGIEYHNDIIGSNRKLQLEPRFHPTSYCAISSTIARDMHCQSQTVRIVKS